MDPKSTRPQGPFLQRLVRLARGIFRHRASELGMSSQEVVRERIDEERSRGRMHQGQDSGRTGSDQAGSPGDPD